jgi:hypothetical protein
LDHHKGWQKPCRSEPRGLVKGLRLLEQVLLGAFDPHEHKFTRTAKETRAHRFVQFTCKMVTLHTVRQLYITATVRSLLSNPADGSEFPNQSQCLPTPTSAIPSFLSVDRLMHVCSLNRDLCLTHVSIMRSHWSAGYLTTPRSNPRYSM